MSMRLNIPASTTSKPVAGPKRTFSPSSEKRQKSLGCSCTGQVWCVRWKTHPPSSQAAIHFTGRDPGETQVLQDGYGEHTVDGLHADKPGEEMRVPDDADVRSGMNVEADVAPGVRKPSPLALRTGAHRSGADLHHHTTS